MSIRCRLQAQGGALRWGRESWGPVGSLWLQDPAGPWALEVEGHVLTPRLLGSAGLPTAQVRGALCGLGLCSRGPTGCLTFREHLGPWHPLLQTSQAGDAAAGWGLFIEGLSKPWPQTSSSAVLGAGSSCLDSRCLRLGQSLNAGCRAAPSRPQDDG